jgi:hypothetical protein
MIKKLGSFLFLFIVLFVTQNLIAQSSIIPGLIEAENFNNGGEGVAYHDTTAGNTTSAYRSTDVDIETNSAGSGYHIAYIDAGEWLAYTVSPTAGYYYIKARVCAASAGGSFHVEFDGVDNTGAVTVPNTGDWNTWTTVTVGPIELTGAIQLMKICMNNGPFNLDWIEFDSTTDVPTPSPSPTPEPTVSPNPPAIAALHVENEWMKDSSGNNVMLRGVAIGDLDAVYHGDRSQVVQTSAQDIIDRGSTSDWNIDVFRLPVHADVNDETGHHGWNVENTLGDAAACNNFFNNIIDPVVMQVIGKGKYVIVDWHYVGVSWTDATVAARTKEFWLGTGAWAGIAAKYANNPNVLFELFNEPGGGSWSDWQNTAQGWVNGIRAVANNIIIVGGPNWSQVTPQKASDLLTGGNIVYACHIYPQHCGTSVPNWIDYVSTVAPVMMTEWGYELNGPAPVGGTTSGYGNLYKNWINSKPNVSWIAWCFDFIYHSYMFDASWTLLGNGNSTAATRYFGGVDGGSHGLSSPADTSDNYMGQFVKTWLSEPKPNGGTSGPTPEGTSVPVNTAVPPVITPEATIAPVDTAVPPVVTPEVTPAPTPLVTSVPGTPAPTPLVTSVPAMNTAAPGTCDNAVTGNYVGFNTTGAFCFKIQGTINGWGSSNCDGRTVSVTVNGTGTAVTTIGGKLPAKGASDYYYFSWSAGNYSYAAVNWW